MALTTETSELPLYSNLAEPDMVELVEEYVADIPQIVHVLESALASENWQELKRQAHRLKGSAGGYGFPSVSVAAGALENCFGENVADKVLERTQRLVALCRRIRNTPVNLRD